MPHFKYVGDDARVYPDLSLEVTPGEVVELDEAPADGRWKPHSDKKADKADKPAEEA